MKKIHKNRASFVLDVLNNSKSDLPRIILDVGFIGEYDEANMHYKILDTLRDNDILIGMDNDKKKLDGFLNKTKTKEYISKLNLDYKEGSVFKTNLSDNQIDVVVMLEVFEHLQTPYTSLNEIKRILKSGGEIIMTYPNPLSLNKMLRFVFQSNLLNSKYLKTFKGADDHLVFPHPACLINYLQDLGFEVKDIKFIKYDIAPLSAFNGLFARTPWIRKFSSYIGIRAIKL